MNGQRRINVVPQKVIDRRRARNKAARKSRRINRQAKR